MGNAAAIDAGATEKMQLAICNFWFPYSDDIKLIFKLSKLDRGMYLDIVRLCIVVIERLTAQIYSQGFLGRDECYRYWKTRMKGFQC